MKAIRLAFPLLSIVAAPAAFGQADPTKLFCSSPADLCISDVDPDAMIRNPTTGVMEKIESLVFNPYGSVLTDLGHYVWAGPLTIGYTFTIPEVPKVEASAAIPESINPPRPARPAQAEIPAIPARTMIITGVVLEPDTNPDDDNDDPPPPPQPPIQVQLQEVGKPETLASVNLQVTPPPGSYPADFAGSAGQPPQTLPPPPAIAGEQNQHKNDIIGRWGDNGRDGWGIEICFFGCWTIGEAAHDGDPGADFSTPVTEVVGNIVIRTIQNGASGVSLSRQGGNGGSGGDAWGALPAGNGGGSGRGGDVTAISSADIQTAGIESHGIYAQSRAGIGGPGGDGYIFSGGGRGGPAAVAGNAEATNAVGGHIVTTGDSAIGVFAQSIGGGGGNGGDSYGLVGDAGSASFGGHGANATASNYGYVSTGTSTNGVSTGGKAAHGVMAQSVGGKGGSGGNAGGIVGLGGGASGGGDGGIARATNGVTGVIITQGMGAIGLYAQSVGGGGGDGGSASAVEAVGGSGGAGGNGKEATANNLAGGTILTIGEASYGILAQSIGGGGGSGGDSGGVVGIGGKGTSGGQGEHATVNNFGQVDTNGLLAYGVLVQSVGGGGGAGGAAAGLVAIGGSSDVDPLTPYPNNGGEVDFLNDTSGLIRTRGQGAIGVLAQSIGGGGGAGGSSTGGVALGGSGGAGGNGGEIDVINRGTIETLGIDAKGVVAQSIGGGGGSAALSAGAVALGGSGARGGNGGSVDVRNTGGEIFTHAQGADGILAQSIGGGGGNGASAAGIGALGGAGAGGGQGLTVDVTNTGTIRTGLDVILPDATLRTGSWARGILAQSIGGGGGNGGDSGGLISIGGSATASSSASQVTVNNSGTISTRGNLSSAIEAQSVGGGGGSGGSSGGVFMTIGGQGGGGGDGGKVVIENTGSLSTLGNDSHGIFAQSVGGGGGNGGNAGSMSLFAGVTVGGNGGGGGAADTVRVGSQLAAPGINSIQTEGDRAKGILAQSIGGGGGNGGFAANVTLGYEAGAAAAVGGAGGAGKKGGNVEIWNSWNILTDGDDSDGIVAQSVGGSGGNGGFALAFSGTVGDVAGAAFAAGVGGKGGGGGDGGNVQMRAGGDIATGGANSDGIVAQSIGGGGGTGGFAITVAAGVAGGAAGSAAVSVGGAGGDGGNAGLVDVQYTGDILTESDNSFGAILQAVGGRGGTGGFTVTGAVSGGGGASASAAIGVGGDGGGAGNGGTVLATLTGDLETHGDRSTGLVAQSVGGAGGNGGFSISGVVSGSGTATGGVSVGVGGAGGAGGTGGLVNATLNGNAATRGVDADAVLIQSVGGGGGNGGMATAGVITGAGGGSGAVAVGVGGTGGDAGNSGVVIAHVTGNLATLGDGSNAYIAQSIGGGGGNGGMAVSGAIAAAGSTSGAVAVGVGGAGGGGGNGQTVNVTLTGDAMTVGNDATAVIAQSLGGGGGNGGIAVGAAISASGGTSGAVAVGVGGSGGGGGTSALTTLIVSGDVDTVGTNSDGIVAQSVGGGGGNGALSIGGALSASGGTGGAVGVGVGGYGGNGGSAGGVNATITGDIHTRGSQSVGVTAQSIGGGGGNGGMSVGAALNASGGNGAAVAVGVGGGGGSASHGALVTADIVGNVQTDGDDSIGFFAQSVGGGGGSGGLSVAGALNATGGNGGAIAVGVGGAAGGGGNGRAVDASITGNTLTRGDNSIGVLAQSLGGGGGNGGMTVSAAVIGSVASGAGVAVGVGGSGGGAGSSALTTLDVVGDVETLGENSAGVLAQSVGGGGGNGGMSFAAALTAAGSNGAAVAVGVGGSGGGGGSSGGVTSTVGGHVRTHGNNSNGVTMQSIGGGGGNGAMNISGALSATGSSGGSVAVGVGGGGGGAGDGGAIDGRVFNGIVETLGQNSTGVLMQSVGGGGGNGGMNVSGAIAGSAANAGAVAVGVGGSAGGGGSANAVVGEVDADVITRGDESFGVLLQSVGGGGGNGAMNISGALTAANGGSAAISIGVGGSGGTAGHGLDVHGIVNGDVATLGERSTGVLAQSVGGGGGNGGMNVSGAVSLNKQSGGALSVGVGGFGGGGGNANFVELTRVGETFTNGANSDGVVAQSIGGGGGNGGINVSGALAYASGNNTSFVATIGVGGFGGAGGDALGVTANVTGNVIATGLGSDRFELIDGISQRVRANGSNGVLAQSVGGSGGNGGMNVSGGISLAPTSTGHSHALNVGVGGFGGSGGNAEIVRLTVEAANVQAIGDARNGVTAQSIGGGGGNGGMNVSGGIALDGVITAGVGGFGGDGGYSNDVFATANTDIRASGANAFGFVAQSIGGGGGTGATNISGGIQANLDSETPTLVFGIGGFGGAGNVSGAVTANQHGTIAVDGVNSTGVLVQSIAGGGGAGGLNVTGNLAAGNGFAAAIGIGGDAGDGADSRAVTLTSDGDVYVDGRAAVDPDFAYTDDQRAALIATEFANGIVVQSIGGGGGLGAMNVTGVSGGLDSSTAVAGVGGSGAGGGNAGAVVVTRGLVQAGLIRTDGNHATALVAQSIGGGGGNAGMNFAASFAGKKNSSDDNEKTVSLTFAMGGSGGQPGNGDTVDVIHQGDILTTGDGSGGIEAQSIGGGGGSANYNLGIAANQDAQALAVAVGGGAGEGGDGGRVDVEHTGNIETLGRAATAIHAQSIGGGGGNAGTDLPTSLLIDGSNTLTVTVGKYGGEGGIAGDVEITSTGDLLTHGEGSIGIHAQSVGNGGGSSGAWGGSAQVGNKEQAHQVAVAVGLEGGIGGHGGAVDVHSEGSITTVGTDAYAILAESIGGGGGGGGSAFNAIFNTTNSIAVGVGASGGRGAAGGTVRVDNSANLTTLGDHAHGIYATSTGGGGGVGGYAGQFRLPGGENTVKGSTALSSQVGGNGGTGAVGNTVEVLNRGTIYTAGRAAFGVNAQSIGGGGGFGGMVFDGNLAGGGSANSATVNIGGSGDDGGTGGAVVVTNEGLIHTVGEESVGIRAQSIGGSGGDAGIVMDLTIAATASTSMSAGMRLGGTGGKGGTSGDVTVTNKRADGATAGGEIATEGRAAHGIFAQSLAGGGGNGSSIVTANFTTGVNSVTGAVNIGGSGGEGGVAGNVTVDNEERIDTVGDGSHGVFAQSIGGGGGNGGLVLAMNAVLAADGGESTPMVVLGGAGGAGDDGGNVTVNNSGQIVTRGANAQGILAQSIGGGGGNANIALGAGSAQSGTASIAGRMASAFGGQGGHGGAGGEVTVNHSGDITVSGAGSQAVMAESINGGGGHVTLDFTGVTSVPGGTALPNGVNIPQNSSGGAADPVIVFNGGGDHQENSNAGQVHLNYTGTFGVAGNNGAANAVQAVGGGGGTYNLTLSLNDTAAADDDVAIEGRLGGVSGTNNRGGDIESSHDGDLVTEGDNTPGALVQSIGGGGGRANLDLSSENGSIGATNLTLGGQDGNNEEGGDIQHDQNGSVATQGNAAHGGLFQSVGGGGGSLSLIESEGASPAGKHRPRGDKLRFVDDDGAAAQAQARVANVPQLSFGSSGGSLLKGGNVGLELAGNIRTTGDNSLGMIFQSVGAGGGVATVLGVDGLAVTLGGSNGASGDGGNLSVVNSGDVMTAGARSHGVFLQSIGGGGSAVFTDAEAALITLSSDNIGSGGSIAFEQNGKIVTLGDQTYSLFAQSVGGGGGYVDGVFAASAGGTGSAGAIDLALNGDIAALGEGSTALFAQSAGANGLGGNITAILVADKQVLAGENGVAVYFDGGAVNSFTNRGIVRTLSGLQGFAFRGGAGGDSIGNFGAVMGNIDLGGGVNAFANNAGAILYSGTTISLGDAGNFLVNEGTLVPGAENLAVHTNLDGSYRQGAQALADFEMDLSTGLNDSIIATGAGEVAGRLRISLLNVHNIRPGYSEMPVFVTQTGIVDRGVTLDAQRSIVINYDLHTVNGRTLAVGYDVDFNAAGLQGNRRAVGEYLNRVQRRAGHNGLGQGIGQTITAAVLTTDLDVYADMLTQLGTEFYAEQQALALKGVQRFSRNLQNCGTLSLGETAGDDTGCVWARYDDNPSTRDTRAGFPAAHDSGYSVSTGVQAPRDGGWTFGVGVDFEDHRGSGYDGSWTADGKFLQVGGSARREFGSSSVGATLSLGESSESVTRLLGVTEPRHARGDRSVDFLSNVLDYTYDIAVHGFTLQPSVSLGTSMLRYGGMTEQGANAQNAVIVGGSETHLWAEPAIAGRYSTTFGSGASLRTFLRLGLMQYLSGTSTKVRAGLSGAPDEAAPMRIGSDLDRTHFVGEVGLQYQTAEGFTVGVSYSRQESEIREGDAGSFRFLWPLR
ncbi:MAG: autotransporter outer membrane beta-barrel domain-containing protein [Pseudomonadota bacterium]